MAKRTAKLVCATVACVVAAPLVASAQSAGGASDECLPGPKGVAPQGQHWYYRVDRATKRQCWYLREQGERTSQPAASAAAAATAPLAPASPSAPATPSVSATASAPTPSAPKPKTVVRAGPVEDAHAEWPAPQPGNAALAPPAPQPAPAMPASPQAGNSAPQDGALQAPAVGSRWPDQSSAPATAASASAARAFADARSPAKTARRPSAASSAAPAPTDADSGSQSFQKLLLVMLGALALAGLAVGVIFRFGPRYRSRQLENRPRGRVNWDAATTGVAAQPRETVAAVRWTDAAEEIGAQPIDAAATSDAALAAPHSETEAAASSPAAQSEPPLDADIDRITAMLEQLIKQGPKLDRMVSAPTAGGPQAASGARA